MSCPVISTMVPVTVVDGAPGVGVTGGVEVTDEVDGVVVLVVEVTDEVDDADPEVDVRNVDEVAEADVVVDTVAEDVDADEVDNVVEEGLEQPATNIMRSRNDRARRGVRKTLFKSDSFRSEKSGVLVLLYAMLSVGRRRMVLRLAYLLAHGRIQNHLRSSNP
jgi:hypothetical protein